MPRCEECGALISPARMRAVPNAELCTPCAALVDAIVRAVDTDSDGDIVIGHGRRAMVPGNLCAGLSSAADFWEGAN